MELYVFFVDFKVSINPVLQVDQYPLPRIEDIFATLAAGQHFSTMDLRQAYLQMEVEEKSKKLLTINISQGLFHYNVPPTVWCCIFYSNLAKNELSKFLMAFLVLSVF